MGKYSKGNVLTTNYYFAFWLFLPIATGEICLTSGCLSLAKFILENKNSTVNPCDDFYEYSCGNFFQNYLLTFETPFVSTLSNRHTEYLAEIKESPKKLSEPDYVRKSKDFFLVCMTSNVNYEIQTIKRYVEENLGGIPVISMDDWDEDNFNWDDMLLYLTKNGFQNTGIFHFNLKPKTTDFNQMFRIEYQPSALYITLENGNMTFDLAKTKLEDIIKKILEIFQVKINDAKEFSIQINDVVKFMFSYMELPTFSRPISLSTIEKLQIDIPEFNWIKAFQKLTKSPVSPDTNITIEGLQWLKSVINLVHDTPKRVIANYLVLNAIGSLYVNQEFHPTLQSKIQNTILNVTGSQMPYKPHTLLSSFCVQHASHLSKAVKALHYKQYFLKDIKDSVSQMVKLIHEKFLELYYNSGPEGDNLDIQQLLGNNTTNLPLVIGIEDEYLDDITLDDIYEQVNADWKSFTRNLFMLKNFQVSQWLNGNIKITEGLQLPDVKYIGSLDTGLQKIVIPSSLLSGIIFAIDRPQAINFAMLGFKIAEGLTMYIRPYTNVIALQSSHTANPMQDTHDYTSSIYPKQVKHVLEFQQWPEWKERELYKTVVTKNFAVKLSYNTFLDRMLENDEDRDVPGIHLNSEQLFWLGFTTLHCDDHKQMFTQFLPYYTPYINKISVLTILNNNQDFQNSFNCQN